MALNDIEGDGAGPASSGKLRLSIDVDIRQALGQVILLLKSGNFVEGEKLLSQLIRAYVGEPDKSLFRLFQLDADPRLVPRFDAFKDIVESMEDTHLRVCFQTIVGPWAVDDADTPVQAAWEKGLYQSGRRYRAFEAVALV
jgi:hypothetical protein